MQFKKTLNMIFSADVIGSAFFASESPTASSKVVGQMFYHSNKSVNKIGTILSKSVRTLPRNSLLVCFWSVFNKFGIHLAQTFLILHSSKVKCTVNFLLRYSQPQLSHISVNVYCQELCRSSIFSSVVLSFLSLFISLFQL